MSQVTAVEAAPPSAPWAPVLDALWDLPTPALVIDERVVVERYLEMRRALPEVAPHYAVKANPAPVVLQALARAGAGFDVASIAEFDLVEGLVDPAEDVLFSNPIKPAGHVAQAHARGVRHFAFDSEQELRKLARHAPGARVHVRLAVDDSTSLFPLSRKFGVGAEEGHRLLLLAGELGLVPYGVTFHVGSQCTDVSAWQMAIARCGLLLRQLHRSGVALPMLDLGGGFPARYTDPVPSTAAVADAIRAALDRLPHRPQRLVSEPGRYLVAESGVLVASVIAVTDRADGRWVYLDVSGYHGLMEALQTGGRWQFPIRTTADRPDTPLVPCTVTGPSCDSSDTLFYGTLLPADLAEGDRVVIGSAGAYTTSYATHFNGFPPPVVVPASALAAR